MIYIRKPTANDIEALEHLFQCTRQSTFTARSSEAFRLGDYVESTRDDDVWVAEDNGAIVGFVSVYHDDNFIHNLFVHPAHQGKGIGKTLLRIAEQNLGRPMTLKAALENPRSFTFYERYGWHQVSVHPEAEEPYALYRKAVAIK
jgi:ribosomal protein S18 acetylase RimI-like enzyme